MKKTLLTITAVLIVTTAIAQERVTAYVFTYEETYVREIGKPFKNDRITLTITPDGRSGCWSANNREQERLIHEILEEAGDNVLTALPKIQSLPSGQHEEYYKNIPERGHITVVYNDLKRPILYTEALKVPEWTQGTEIKEICGYSCKRATTHFYGRNWIAWFAPEIPVSDGPWMFNGLPGLILEASDSEGLFLFNCVGITVEEVEPLAVPDRKYRKTDHVGFNKFVVKLHNDPLSTINRGNVLKITNANGNELTGKDLRRECIFIEKEE